MSIFSHFMRSCVALLFWVMFSCVTVTAQDKTLPGVEYDWGIGLMRDGKFMDAQEQFQSELRGGFKIATERWLDSICFASMLGEAQYHMGQFPAALENYETAIRLAIQYADWLTQVQNVPNPGMFTVKPIPWGDPNPGRGLVRVPEKFSILFGDINYGQTYRTGGVVAPPSLKPIRGVEIVRCTMLAIRRRAELLGPMGDGDELNAKLLTRLTQVQRALAGTWFQAWLDMEIGFCHLVAGKTDEAAMAIMRGATINGSAHILTPIAYLELGKLQLRSANYEKAYNFFLEAASVAFYYEDVESMTEAFGYLETAFSLRNPQMICPVLLPAAEWARVKKLTTMFATIQAGRVNDLLRMKQPRPALECLALAEKALGKHSATLGNIGAKLNFLRARIAFLEPSPASQQLGATSLAKAMTFMQFGAVWNFHLNMVDLRLLNGQLTPRKALEAYDLLLREPTATDWALKPMEALAVSMTPRPGTWENYFLCAIEMEKKENALEISERARRAAYLQTLDFGGRMHSLRLLLEGPENDLSVTQRQRKRDILMEYPAYENCSKKVAELRLAVRKMSLPVTQKEEAQKLAGMLKEISELSRTQEFLLTAMVLDSRVIDIVFPKVRTCKEIQESLPKGEAMLVYYAARNQLFMFLMNNERLAMWKIVDSGAGAGGSKKNKAGNLLTSLQLNTASLLKEIGLGSGVVKAETLKEDEWKKVSQRVMADLTKNSQANFASADFTSLVIVPDRFAWYIPFETLQIQTAKGARPTISQFAIRYAPMASLGTPWKALQLPKSPYSLIVAGEKGAGQKGGLSEKTLRTLEKPLERPVVFEPKSFGGVTPGSAGTESAVFATEFDKMLIFADLKNDDAESYKLFPLALDYGMKNSTLGHWFYLPYGAPRLVILSGMHTQCEGLAKKSKRKASASAKTPVAVPGQELFLTSMAFLANGSDTVILPRWRLEGNSPAVLSALFLAQLEKSETASEAWRKAVLRFAGEEISITSEPRIGKNNEIERVSATHPFFWAGNLLIDSGSGSLRTKERLSLAIDGEVAEEAEVENDADINGNTNTNDTEEEEIGNEEENADNAEKEDETIKQKNRRNDGSGNGRLAPLPPMGGGIPMGGGMPMGGGINATPLE